MKTESHQSYVYRNFEAPPERRRSGGTSQRCTHLVIISAVGELKINERFCQSGQECEDGTLFSPLIYAYKTAISDDEQNAAIWVIRDNKSGACGRDAVWLIDIANGKHQGAFYARECGASPPPRECTRIIDLREVPGTSLFLVHSFVDQKTPDREHWATSGAIWTLIDQTGRTLWSKEMLSDYMTAFGLKVNRKESLIVSNRNAYWHLGRSLLPHQFHAIFEEFERVEPLRSAATDGQFSILDYTARKLVTYLAKYDERTGWSVTEVGELSVRPD